MITDHRTTFFSGCAALGLTTGVVAAVLTWAPPVVLQEAPARPATGGTLSAPPWTPPAMTRTASSTVAPRLRQPAPDLGATTTLAVRQPAADDPIEIDWPTPTGRPAAVPTTAATSESPEPIVTTPSTVPAPTSSDLED